MGDTNEDIDEDLFGNDEGFFASFSFADTIERIFASLMLPFAWVASFVTADAFERIFSQPQTWFRGDSAAMPAAERRSNARLGWLRWRLAKASEAVVERFFWFLEFVDWLIQTALRFLLFLISPWRWFRKTPKRPVSDPWN